MYAKILGILLSVCIGLTAAAYNYEPLARGGGDDPWPWGQEIEFPWKGTSGVWKTTQDGVTTYFKFKVKKKRSTQKNFLEIEQFDPETCVTLAKGSGVENAKAITAHMIGPNGTYRLRIVAFEDENSPAQEQSKILKPDAVMVMSISEKLKGEETVSDMELEKVQSLTAYKCSATKKNQ